MTVWRSHIWYEHGVLQAAILVGWQIPHGPHEGCVLVYFPGDTTALPRVVSGGGWHGDRLSAELEAASTLRRIAERANEQASQIAEVT